MLSSGALTLVTMNTGQACFAATRIYVQSGIHDAFVSRYKSLVEEKTKLVGNPDDPGTAIGPLVDEAQFNRVLGFMDRGSSQGKLLVGGGNLQDKGFYVKPTVFLDVAEDAEIMRQEIFGPVAIINKFETEEEALVLANNTVYGLMAGIFTKDVTRASKFTAELDSGMVGINAVSTAFWQAPFGGTKESCIGRENGAEVVRSYTEPKTVFVNMNA
ncbi:putative aldehyde dehydrogenase-like protein [Paramyrothecium foliicola]|nr:putative aldehyde dehydrogenase-like protein [Paramyrothecium foliicola]